MAAIARGATRAPFDCPFCREAVHIPIEAGELESRLRDEIDRKLRGDDWNETVPRLRRRRDPTSPPSFPRDD